MSRFQVDGVWYRRADMGENLEFGTNNKSGTLTRFSALCSSLKKKKEKGRRKGKGKKRERFGTKVSSTKLRIEKSIRLVFYI